MEGETTKGGEDEGHLECALASSEPEGEKPGSEEIFPASSTEF